MSSSLQVTHLARVVTRALGGAATAVRRPRRDARVPEVPFDRAVVVTALAGHLAQHEETAVLAAELGAHHPDGPVREAADALQVLAELGARGCRRAGAAAAADLEAQALRRALADAEGHALLADRPDPAGWGELDTLTLAVQGAEGDPDDAVLDTRAWTRLTARSLSHAGTPLDRAFVAEAHARGHDARQVDHLAAALVADEGLAGRLHALTARGDAFRQLSPTTCGSTVLLRLVAQHDPLLALWLATGSRAPSYAPALLARMPPAGWAAPGFADRLGAAQRAVQALTSGRHWPTRFGTLPRDLVRVLDAVSRTTGCSYRGHWLDDQDRPHLRGYLTRAAEAADAGLLVPLYVGGEGQLRKPRTLQNAVPRHVVMITGHDEGRYEVFDPADGDVTWVDDHALLAGTAPRDAFGGWQHLTWIALPDLDRPTGSGAVLAATAHTWARQATALRAATAALQRADVAQS